MHVFSLIQRIDHRLLHLFIDLGVQSIDPDHFLKDLFVVRPDLRHRIGNDGKASLIAPDIAVHDLSLPDVKLSGELLLFFVQLQGILFMFRRKRLFSKHLDHCRTCHKSRQLLFMLIGGLDHFQLALHKFLIKKQGLVVFMIIIELFVGNTAIVTGLQLLTPGQHACTGPAEYRFQLHGIKILNGSLHHPLKSNHIPDLYRPFLGQIFSSVDKSDPVALCIHVGHFPDLFLIQSQKKLCSFLFVFRDIFPEPVQITKILKIAFADQVRGKRMLRIDLIPDAVCHKHVTIITGIPVNGIPDGGRFRLPLFLKLAVDLQEEFHQDIQIFCLPLKYIGNSTPKFGIQSA